MKTIMFTSTSFHDSNQLLFHQIHPPQFYWIVPEQFIPHSPRNLHNTNHHQHQPTLSAAHHPCSPCYERIRLSVVGYIFNKTEQRTQAHCAMGPLSTVSLYGRLFAIPSVPPGYCYGVVHERIRLSVVGYIFNTPPANQSSDASVASFVAVPAAANNRHVVLPLTKNSHLPPTQHTTTTTAFTVVTVDEDQQVR